MVSQRELAIIAAIKALCRNTNVKPGWINLMEGFGNDEDVVHHLDGIRHWQSAKRSFHHLFETGRLSQAQIQSFGGVSPFDSRNK